MSEKLHELSRSISAHEIWTNIKYICGTGICIKIDTLQALLREAHLYGLQECLALAAHLENTIRLKPAWRLSSVQKALTIFSTGS